MKPLGRKSYGSIPHFIGSRMGPADHHCSPGQQVICTEKKRDKHDNIIVQEKLDGGNVGIAKVSGKILAITRAGYLAETSPYKTHHAFKIFVQDNYARFDKVLNEGERLCGEWLLTSVGTKYNLPHEPLVIFDLMTGSERTPINILYERLKGEFVMPRLLGVGCMTIEQALTEISTSGHGAIEPVEGIIWRVERKGKVDFLCKYVRPEKVDGKYLDQDIFNGMPEEFEYLKY